MKAKGFIVGAGLAIAVSMAAPANAITPFNVPGTSLWDHPFVSVFDTRSGLDLEANGIAFNQALSSGYVELSDDRRSEERRFGRECVRTCRSGWQPVD